MFFVIPEMPAKTFFMLYKKLPDHFNIPRLHAMPGGAERFVRDVKEATQELLEVSQGFIVGR